MNSRARGKRRRSRVDGPHPVDVYVGSRVRLRRSELGMGQMKLASQLGLTYQQVQKYESGADRISASRLYQICGVLGVEVSFFYEGYEPAAEAFEPDPLQHPDTIRLIEAFFAINDPELRRRLLDLARTLAGERTRRRGRPLRSF